MKSSASISCMWVPPTHETFAIQIDVNATVADNKMTGTYKVVEINTTAEAKAPFGSGTYGHGLGRRFDTVDLLTVLQEHLEVILEMLDLILEKAVEYTYRSNKRLKALSRFSN